jgi:hypothetical protein
VKLDLLDMIVAVRGTEEGVSYCGEFTKYCTLQDIWCNYKLQYRVSSGRIAPTGATLSFVHVLRMASASVAQRSPMDPPQPQAVAAELSAPDLQACSPTISPLRTLEP